MSLAGVDKSFSSFEGVCTCSDKFCVIICLLVGTFDSKFMCVKGLHNMVEGPVIEITVQEDDVMASVLLVVRGSVWPRSGGCWCLRVAMCFVKLNKMAQFIEM